MIKFPNFRGGTERAPIADNSIHFRGNALGVLLVHGLGGTPVELRSVARGVARTNATVLCCQLKGHCGSSEDLLETGWRDWYASVEEALCRLEESCTRIVVGGLSMGAILAARLAAHQPERVHGVVMLAPTLWYDGWSLPWYRFLLQMLSGTFLGNYWHYVEKEPFGVKDMRTRAAIELAMLGSDSSKAGLLATPARSINQLQRLVTDVRSCLPRVKQPALIVHPREDDVASLTNAFYLQRRLGGLVETLVLDDSYHLITLDRQRELVLDRVCTFVDGFQREMPAKPAARLQAV